MAPTPSNAPVMTDLTVSYSIGAKVQIVKYELSGDVHLSRTEKYNVDGMTPEEIDDFYEKRYQHLHEELGRRVEAEVEELTEVR